VSFPDLGRRVLEAVVLAHLGNRADFYDVSGVVNTIVDRVGFVDMNEIDPLVLEEILDQNRKSV
jgi:hypothetical protein